MELRKAMYGTRKAGQLWQETIYKALEEGAFTVVATVAGMWYHEQRDIVVLVHGDDFLGGAESEDLDWFEKLLQMNFSLKSEGRVGPQAGISIRYLKRTIGWSLDGFTYCGDRSHVERVSEEFGLGNAKSAPTPGTRSTGKGVRDALDELGKKEYEQFRRGAGIVSFIAHDRFDIQFATKTVLQDTNRPTKLSMMRLVRIARYLIGKPVLAYEYRYQEWDANVEVFVDSDWAGEEETRRSTTAIVEMLGSHCLHHLSSTQAVVATSSGEAEFHAIGRGTADGILTQNALSVLGIGKTVTLTVLSDSSAGRGMCMRRGAGRVRHLDIKYMWIQEYVKQKRVVIGRVGTEVNIADAGTKYLDEGRLAFLMGRCHMVYR